MNKLFSILNKVLTIFVVFTLTGQSIVQAQPPQQDGKPRIDYSDSTGKVVFIGADANAPLIVRAAKAPGLSRSESALAMVSQYEADFGLRDAESELQLLSEKQVDNRNVTRFQQVYQGIPVIAGEMVVNANENAGLLSLSGEIAPDLDINPKPTITAQQATEIAAEFMQKVHDLTAAEITFTTPELWIYDSRLLQPDGTAPALVWRIEAQANNNLPVNEFILIDATRGHIALNFNQVDTAWAVPGNGSAKKNPTAQIATITPTPPQPTSTPEPTQPSMPDSTHSQTDIQPTATLPAEKTETGQSEKSSPLPQLGVTYYVDITGGNNSNSCTAPASPCKNIQETINKAGTGDIIRIASGVYTLSTNPSPNVVINNGKNLTLSGGWDSGFALQSGVSTIDGGNVNNGYLQTGGTVTIENFIIQNSTSADSGAIYMVSGALNIKSSTLKNNYASNRGGGIFMAGSGTLTVENSTISGNTALISGAGMYLANGTGATVTIKNSTISNNAVTGGSSSGGGFTQANGASITLTNSIVANNTAGSNPDCNGTLSSASYNIIENASGCTITNGSNNSNVDPMISISLSGTFQVHTPQVGSPAINSGTNTGCPSTDQLGNLRPQGTSCDIGSVEIGQNTIFVLSGNNQFSAVNTAF
ncbi:MAG: hypothetical protein JNM00_06350, partial [Flavobacteriales bacterium]|nr:hypothetical protein [Flavobacteriales bacterium]